MQFIIQPKLSQSIERTMNISNTKLKVKTSLIICSNQYNINNIMSSVF